MKTPTHPHARNTVSRAARAAEVQLRTQYLSAPDLFSDRDDDAAEYAAILRDFERVHDEATDVERYS